MKNIDKELLQNLDNGILFDDMVENKLLFFQNPKEEIKVFSIKDLKKAFERIEKLKEKYFLAGYLRYEFKNLLLEKEVSNDKPYLYFGVFEKPIEVNKINTNDIYSPYVEVENSINFKEYESAIKKIKKQIELGNTYQVNYTFKNLIKAGCSIENLYFFLRQNQKTRYGAFIKNSYDTILSFSPELFFEIDKNKLTTKPMKGTIRKGFDNIENEKNKAFLANDEKNMAENVMIVDLLRNDMGIISETSSVEVKKLFEIEEYETLYQMTSTIKSELKNNVTFEDVIRALFPCGSITGAPKISTMNIIDDIENSKRDVYCGAIGYVSKEKTVMSVPIRIIQKQEEKLVYHTGSGITYPSCPKQEWDECLLKMDFLKFKKDFSIVETIAYKNKEILFEKEHFERMKKSAKFFGFDMKQENFEFDVKKDCIIRVLLNKKGEFNYEYLPLQNTKTNKVVISRTKTDSKNIFLNHKTTYRPWYDDAMKMIKNDEVYDVLFLNEKNEITEGARSNILVEIGDRMYTPCSSCGILRGIYLNKLIYEGKCIEKILGLDDLKRAKNIYLINSVRGIQKVELISQYSLSGV